MSVFEVPAQELIEEIAVDLKENKKVPQPTFVPFIKSGVHRERAPQNKDWWFIRTASILRRIYIDGPLGTEDLRNYYGGKKARGVRPHRKRKASGKVIRTCLQALEKQKLIEQVKPLGRKITSLGEKYLNQKAKEVSLNLENILKEKAVEKIKQMQKRTERDRELQEARKVKAEIQKTVKKEKIKKKKEDEKKEEVEKKKEKKKK